MTFWADPLSRGCPIHCSRHNSIPVSPPPLSDNNQCLQTLSKVPWGGKLSLAENSALNYIPHRELWSIYLSSSSITKSAKCENACVSNVGLLQYMKVKSESEVAQSCPTLSDPMDRSPPGSSAHGIFQARVLEWGAIAFSAVRR